MNDVMANLTANALNMVDQAMNQPAQPKADIVIRDESDAYNNLPVKMVTALNWRHEKSDCGLFWEPYLLDSELTVDVTAIRNTMDFEKSQVALSLSWDSYVAPGPGYDPEDLEVAPVSVRLAAYKMITNPETGQTWIYYEVEADGYE